MVAALTVRVNTAAAAGTESASQIGIDFCSADNATNTIGNRQTNPITVGGQSYEKWLTLKVDTKPANEITNVEIWGDGGVATSSTLNFTGEFVTGTTPVATVSTIADDDFDSYTGGAKATWDAGPYSFTDDVTAFAVFQLAVAADSNPGNWAQETISYSYDET